MYNYPCKVVRVIDGDTAVLEVNLGFNIRFTETFRLLGINAPEKRGISFCFKRSFEGKDGIPPKDKMF